MKDYEQSEDYMWDKVLNLQAALGSAIDALNQIPNTKLHPTSYINNPSWTDTYKLIPYLEKVLEGN